MVTPLPRSGSLLLVLLLGCEGSFSGGSAPLDVTSATPPPIKGSCGGTTGRTGLRRLTNREHSNTLQDLLYLPTRPPEAIQENAQGASGFTNDANVLTVSPVLINTVYEQAEQLAATVVASKGTANGAWAKLVTCQPSAASCANETVRRLARRALRRQVTAEDEAGLLEVFRAAGTFDQGLSDVIVSLLLHPEFLLVPVVDARSQDPSARFDLDDDELAARLSFFLWQSMPDDALFALADSGRLKDADQLAAQISRMLRDPRAAHFRELLRDELTGLRALSRSDFTQLGQTNALRDALVGETDAFFADLLANDRSALTLLTGTRTFANKTLADFYGAPFPAGTPSASFVPLELGRVGIGAQGAVLIATAGGSTSFTNPIKRGHWLASKLLCDEPPAPPPGVPPLPSAMGAATTIRERLAVHTAQDTCKGCHHTMDAVGLGAENYDALGRWRTRYADGNPVDAAGQLPDGTPFTTSRDLFAALGRNEQARGCVPQQLFKLALSRALERDDVCAAERLAAEQVTDSSTFSGLLTAIASSPQFQTHTGEAP